MEIKEVSTEEAEEYQKEGQGEKSLRKSDKILERAKESLAPAAIAKVRLY